HEVTMYYPMRMVRTRTHKYILNLAPGLEYPHASDLWGSPTWQCVLSRGDKFMGQKEVAAFLHRPKEELYDLTADPNELKNRAAAPAQAKALDHLRRKSGMIDEHRLTAYLQRREFTRGLPTDPREFADDMIRDAVLTNFQAEQFLLGKWRGFTIGKYKLLERVGVGGMGQVFLCEHMFMRKRLAVKVLPPAKAEQPAALGRFYREARAAGSLDHPNIVRTHDIDQDGNLHFIVMDYIDGSNLLDTVKKFGPMDVGRATHYMKQVAD